MVQDTSHMTGSSSIPGFTFHSPGMISCVSKSNIIERVLLIIIKWAHHMLVCFELRKMRQC